jgi:hypothetical protein
MSIITYTFIHVLISLVALLSGFVVLFGLISGKRMDAWTALFLSTTIATSVTGFGFPFSHVLRFRLIGLVSLIILTVAVAARYLKHLHGSWGRTYVVCASLALYLNTFVGIVHSFQKIPILIRLAFTHSELPFLAAQAAVLAIFVVLGTLAARKSSLIALSRA